MKRTRYNRQLFALRDRPPDRLPLRGRFYELVLVFKHDFFAATCLYKALSAPAAEEAGALEKVVVKFSRAQPLLGIPMAWLGRLLSRREEAVYRLLDGVRGVPRWAGRIDATCHAVEYIDARPLDHPPAPPPEFWDRLRRLFDEVHARGVGYCDGNKRSNILIGAGDEPFLIDYQISIRRRDGLIWPWNHVSRAMVRNIVQKDLYHLYKHKRRMCPETLTPEEQALGRGRTPLHQMHRRFTRHYRAVRRWLLRKLHREGKLVSPSAELEDHFQPEKQTWRTDDASHEGHEEGTKKLAAEDAEAPEGDGNTC